MDHRHKIKSNIICQRTGVINAPVLFCSKIYDVNISSIKEVKQMTNEKNFRKVISYIPDRIATELKNLPDESVGMINEIRLRINRPVIISMSGRNFFLSYGGRFSENPHNAVTADASDINGAFRAVCDYSVHSYQRQISDGYITIEGGNRVGICGTAVSTDNNVDTLKYISGLNFRISGQVNGCGKKICDRLFSDKPVGLLVIGPPLSGKTTVLKDICRTLGNRFKVSVIDERSEIGAVYHGQPQNDIGIMTDVFDSYPKESGITTAVRVMSPDIIVCDEIGGRADCKAIMKAVSSGVRFIATAHGNSIEEIKSNRHMSELIATGIFQYYVLLGSGTHIGEIMLVRKIC